MFLHMQKLLAVKPFHHRQSPGRAFHLTTYIYIELKLNTNTHTYIICNHVLCIYICIYPQYPQAVQAASPNVELQAPVSFTSGSWSVQNQT